MKFNNGSERVRLENRWKKLRIQYREAGMSEDAIQAMYQFDLDVLNERPKHILSGAADFDCSCSLHNYPLIFNCT